ncbi:Hsp33 family molecular chaperone HslO [Paracoccus liaowanqingii]|uniref:Hsp33 family molecular chaperone HslO n=1 Tax=Paracoccus liaowanqingii TaxID=2560053 RepID=A0A4P7HP12_9RHOB|nr:Hsp33 family molecular chaperone HslO [Paracoccus liaowanqingii]QBX36019.1 Hsp33 family molecular chaperone HslO [Paracoccus liaowanqingii]TGN45944.1 Hsp33 family molecular chaperone HslO [Paracoccus liaowanqingii]
MSKINQIAWDDTVLPFQLDRSAIRGRVVRLDGVLDHVLSRHDYPPAVSALVAEIALLTALIGPTVKLRWKLSLQVRGNGAIRTIAADYFAPEGEDKPARIRAWASFDADRLDARPPFEQIGDGYFAILIDQGPGSTPYQGITPLTGGTLSACAQTYFAQSEQLPTRFQLASGLSRVAGQPALWRAGGIMLQTLPAQPVSPTEGGTGEDGLIAAADILQGVESEDWNRANILLDTVETLELIGPTVGPTDLLLRLFHEETPRVFDAHRVEFGCSCTADRVRDTLAIYSAKDIGHMTTPEGIVTADCQFCGAHYEFDPQSLGFEAVIDAEGNPISGSDKAAE